MRTTTNFRTIKMVQLGLFTAIILLMAFTPLGYIKTPALSITLLVVPVTVGAIVLGPVGGAILGAVFGATSFIQCFGMDPFGTTLFGINPFATFIMCFIPRILMGWLSGLIFLGVKRVDKTKSVSYAVSNLAGPLLNTILFMFTFALFFFRSTFVQESFVVPMGSPNVIGFLLAFVGINGLIEAGACFLLGTAISKTVDVVKARTGN